MLSTRRRSCLYGQLLPSGVAATVVLLHRTPDGGAHFDWLLQRQGGGPLITFRLASRPDVPPPWTLSAERLADHREIYLTFQGTLSGERGDVVQIARGWCDVQVESQTELAAAVGFGGPAGALVGHAAPNGLWDLELRQPARATG
jgi:hypothetical protein